MSEETSAAPEGQLAPGVPAPAPAPAPVPPAVPPAPKAEPAPKADDKGGEEIAYEETGNPGLDYALGFIAKAGIDDSHPALIAASQGDFGLLKAALAEKGIAGWEQAIALGEKAYGEIVEQEQAKVGQIQESVLQVSQGLGVDWEEAVSYAKDNADEAEIEALNGMLQNPATAKMAALYISYAFQNAAGAERSPQATARKHEAAPASQGQGGPITRAEFAAEAGKLHKRLGDSYSASPEYRALAARLQR